MRRHDVLPGISGYAQVNGRNSITWKEKFELDIHYVENQSFFLDIKILILTIIKVISGVGINSDLKQQWKNLMGKTKFLIYGGGGHFRVICSILEKDNVEIVGFFDRDNKSKKIL